MVESQIDLAEGELVSDFEFILPWDVIETCCSLKPQGTSCFVSLNKQAKTSNQLFVSKLEDNSIKIRIRVVNIDADKNKEVENQKETLEAPNDALEETLESPPVQESGAVASTCELTLTDTAEQNPVEELQVAQIPDDAPETSTTDILNKMVNEEQDSVNKNDSASANKSSFSEGLSTVIIVKKVSSVAPTQLTQEIETVSKESSDRSKVNKENLLEDASPNKTSSADQGGFTAMKPKSVEKEDKKEESLNTSSTSQQVTCELCFQHYKSYSHLVRHVRKQHRDCTFVRNYLEEIRPLTITPCPICKRNFTAKSSLDAHLKVSHGGQFVRIRNLPSACSPKQVATSQPRQPVVAETKKLTSKEVNATADRDKTSLTPLGSSKMESESDDDSDSSLEEAVNGKQRVKCDVCNESFETRQQALKHQDRVHRRQAGSARRDSSASSDLFACKYCDKKLKTKELLLKHCLGTHFKSNSSKKSKHRQQSASEEDLVESEDNDVVEEEEEVRKTPARKRSRVEKSDQGPSKSAKRAHVGKVGSAGSASSPDAQGASGFACDLCGMDFNRMTLLVTHARYCRKSTALK